MKIISLDIETAGPDPTQDDILEVGAIYDDLTLPEISDRERFRCVIVPEGDRYLVTPFCATLHQRLWPEIQQAERAFSEVEREGFDEDEWNGYSVEHCDGTVLRKIHPENLTCTWYCRPEMVGWCFFQWISQWKDIKQGDRINVAGKNAAMFDIPFLSEPPYLFLETARVHIRHRILDPAILFFRRGEDTRLPDLATCLSRAGMEPSNLHTSLGDALDVLRLLRYALVM